MNYSYGKDKRFMSELKGQNGQELFVIAAEQPAACSVIRHVAGHQSAVARKTIWRKS